MIVLYTMLLQEIISQKRKEVAALKERSIPEEIREIDKTSFKVRDFAAALKKSRFSLIAEIKKNSPSAGLIIKDFDPVKIAGIYERSGAAAISVLTDEKYFQGKLEYVARVKEASGVPVLRKDFIVDELQIYESRIAGADAILLIASILSDGEIERFMALAGKMEMGCLVETHNEREVERVLKCGAEIIGINNRDLDTLEVDFRNTLRLMEKFPELKKRTVVSESGINSADQIMSLKAAGVSAVLIGEGILKSHDIPAKIKELMG